MSVPKIRSFLSTIFNKVTHVLLGPIFLNQESFTPRNLELSAWQRSSFSFLFRKKRSGESNYGYSHWGLYTNRFPHYFLPTEKKVHRKQSWVQSLLVLGVTGTLRTPWIATTVIGCYGYPQNLWNFHIWGGFAALPFLDGTGTFKTLGILAYSDDLK